MVLRGGVMAKILKTTGMNKCIGCFTCMIVCAAVNEQSHSLSKSRIKIKTAGGMQGRFVSNVCHGCREERPCMEACPSGALEKRPGGGVIFKADICIGCHRCVDACSIQAAHFDDAGKKPLICKHCGICTQFCPHGCLRLEDVQDD
jgi:Fe-S-cluster-containing dehydrogenase component